MRITDVTKVKGMTVITVAWKVRRSLWEWLLRKPVREEEEQYIGDPDFSTYDWHYFPSMESCPVELAMELDDAWEQRKLLQRVLEEDADAG